MSLKFQRIRQNRLFYSANSSNGGVSKVKICKNREKRFWFVANSIALAHFGWQYICQWRLWKLLLDPWEHFIFCKRFKRNSSSSCFFLGQAPFHSRRSSACVCSSRWRLLSLFWSSMSSDMSWDAFYWKEFNLFSTFFSLSNIFVVT